MSAAAPAKTFSEMQRVANVCAVLMGGNAVLDADLAWYRAHRDRLATRHAGEYLAILDQQVVDHDSEFAPLARRVRERFGGRPMLIPKCVAGGRIVNLPTPRLRRP